MRGPSFEILTTVHTLDHAAGRIDLHSLKNARYTPATFSAAVIKQGSDVSIFAFSHGNVFVICKNSGTLEYSTPDAWPHPYINLKLHSAIILYGPCEFNTGGIDERILGCRIQGVPQKKYVVSDLKRSKCDNEDNVWRNIIITRIKSEDHARVVITEFLQRHQRG